MSEKLGSDMISRRKALSFVGLLVGAALVVPPAVLTASDAEAQTAGMVRRQERREARREGREIRRTSRREAREMRRRGRREAREMRREGRRG